MLRGVSSIEPGYAGGHTINPTYASVSRGDTGHAEVIHIDYDPSVITYGDLLTVFFGSHDPTTPNQQGADRGTQYRSIILTTNDEQEREAKEFINELNSSSEFGAPIVTEVRTLDTFYPAEEYHKDYYKNNPQTGYCAIVINPKLEKVKEKFAALLKDESKHKES